LSYFDFIYLLFYYLTSCSRFFFQKLHLKAVSHFKVLACQSPEEVWIKPPAIA